MDVCCLKLWYVWKWSDLDTDYCTLCVCLSAVKVLLKCVQFCSCVPFQFCLLLQDVHNDQVQCTEINSKQKTDALSSEYVCFASLIVLGEKSFKKRKRNHIGNLKTNRHQSLIWCFLGFLFFCCFFDPMCSYPVHLAQIVFLLPITRG